MKWSDWGYGAAITIGWHYVLNSKLALGLSATIGPSNYFRERLYLTGDKTGEIDDYASGWTFHAINVCPMIILGNVIDGAGLFFSTGFGAAISFICIPVQIGIGFKNFFVYYSSYLPFEGPGGPMWISNLFDVHSISVGYSFFLGKKRKWIPEEH